jgi:hypothetical protein
MIKPTIIIIIVFAFIFGLFVVLALGAENCNEARKRYEEQFPIGSQYIISDGKFTVIGCYSDGDVKLLSSTGQVVICSPKVLTRLVKVSVEKP